MILQYSRVYTLRASMARSEAAVSIHIQHPTSTERPARSLRILLHRARARVPRTKRLPHRLLHRLQLAPEHLTQQRVHATELAARERAERRRPRAQEPLLAARPVPPDVPPHVRVLGDEPQREVVPKQRGDACGEVAQRERVRAGEEERRVRVPALGVRTEREREKERGR